MERVNLYFISISALAGAAVGNDEIDFDSDDSLPAIDNQTGGDLDDIDLKDAPKFTEDIENLMSGSKIVPKPLPQVTPDGAALAPQSQHYGSAARHNSRALKRRHSGRDGTLI